MERTVLHPAPDLAGAPRVIRDISARVPGYDVRTILDVGANLGQSCLPLAEALPRARIYAFEPAARSFARLQAAVAVHPNVEPLNLALGARTESAAMTAGGTSVTNRLILPAPAQRPSLAQALGRMPGGPPPEPEAPRRERRQGVEVVAGADFCRDRGIDHVSFLKIDTEGHDLEVVRGFGPFLQIVDFVQVEAATNPYNETHVPLRDFQTVLDQAGFYLFRIYGEAFEFKGGGRPVSRRCNPVFIHRRLVGEMEGIS
ncbi:FkbM family methyltransferase [Roseococcus sp. SYP-B2431]|uniref:FkbM family methyltransferase n=1 Tax=Roseococcus sp. SYP-B2431 TaxID=2496640 RepID=UPI0013F4456C|nr:FkbM family methyltransferase [Roseococcus sp. SYP-B2431]